MWLKTEEDTDYSARKIVFLHRIVYGWISFLLLMTFAGCQEKEPRLPYYNTADFTPWFLTSETEISEKITHSLADFRFQNQREEWVDNSQVAGKIHVANFMFTACGNICPKMTNTMQLVSDAYRKDEDVVILSFSVMPWVDTPEVLATYAANKNIEDENWHFLTGPKNEIYELARKSYFAEEDIGFTKDSTDFLHTEHFILMDENQRIRGIYNGTLKLDVKQLIADIKTLKQEN